MPSTKELRVWLLLGVGLLGVMLSWSIYDYILWPTGGTPEEVVRHLQRHTRLMRSCIGVCAGVVLSGMTRWVYWALCRALDTAKNEACALSSRWTPRPCRTCTPDWKPSTMWTAVRTSSEPARPRLYRAGHTASELGAHDPGTAAACSAAAPQPESPPHGPSGHGGELSACPAHGPGGDRGAEHNLPRDVPLDARAGARC
jgi:hypothetical protein